MKKVTAALNRQINETVALAKELSLAAFFADEQARAIEDEQERAEQEQLWRDARRDAVWLQEHGTRVQISQPGQRLRHGWSKESLAALSAAKQNRRA